MVQLPDQLEVLPLGRHLVDGRVLAGQPADRSATASRTMSRPATRECPESGRSNVVTIRTSVVLPAPFGPSKPSTRPAWACMLTLASAWTGPNALLTSSTSIMASVPVSALGWLTAAVVVT